MIGKNEFRNSFSNPVKAYVFFFDQLVLLTLFAKTNFGIRFQIWWSAYYLLGFLPTRNDLFLNIFDLTRDIYSKQFK